jgi:hypothetical protein
MSEYADELESSKQGPEVCEVCHEQAEFCTCPVEDETERERWCVTWQGIKPHSNVFYNEMAAQGFATCLAMNGYPNEVSKL